MGDRLNLNPARSKMVHIEVGTDEVPADASFDEKCARVAEIMTDFCTKGKRTMDDLVPDKGRQR